MNPSAWIDLRSDTVTRPTATMRRAMAEAEVGDDVYGEDPTVNRLERRAAEIFGKEAGLFVPTGTMGNTIAVKVHTKHGQEVICEARSHVLNYELAMMAWFSGCRVVYTLEAQQSLVAVNLPLTAERALTYSCRKRTPSSLRLSPRYGARCSSG